MKAVVDSRHYRVVALCLLAACCLMTPAVAADDVAERVPISIDFEALDLRSAIQLLANELGHELVLDESVSGRITLRLDDVDPWQA
ncbi:MAG: hypothetical protein WD600_10020, partial [Pseudohongiella sp.]